VSVGGQCTACGYWLLKSEVYSGEILPCFSVVDHTMCAYA